MMKKQIIYCTMTITKGDVKHILAVKILHPRMWNATIRTIVEKRELIKKKELLKDTQDGEYIFSVKLPLIRKKIKILEFENKEDYSLFLEFLNALTDKNYNKKISLEIKKEWKWQETNSIKNTA